MAAVGATMPFKIALAQVSAAEEKAENLKRGLDLIEAASLKQADILVLPELFMAYVPLDAPPSKFASVAEEVDGDFVATLAAAARKKRMHVVVGIFERSAKKDKVYNTVVMIGPDGKVIATHRKLQLFDSFGYKESSRYEPSGAAGGAYTHPQGT